MRKALFVLWLLNLFDALATWYGISHEYASEVNRLMAWAIDHSFGLFFFIKLSLTSAAIGVFWVARAHVPRVVGWVVGIWIALYVLVAGWHLYLFHLYRSQP